MNKYVGHIVDPIHERIYDGCITVENSRITDIEQCTFSNESELSYILPGFIDSHIHVESSLMRPSRFAEIASKHGTIAVVSDPHEIANVLGVEGINYMLQDSKLSNFHFAFCVPSCIDEIKDLKRYYTRETVKNLLKSNDFYGLSEVMDYFAVINKDKKLLDIINYTIALDKVVDGHAPGLTGASLRQYVYQGINTDHEANDLEEAIEKISLGMKIQIREGSAARNFNKLFPLLLEEKYKGKLMFCTDDIYPDELLSGHINLLVEKSLHLGAPLWNVLRAACVTPKFHYKLNTGLLQKGDNADFIIVENLKNFNVLKTIINGHEENKVQKTQNFTPNYFKAEKISTEDIEISSESNSIKVIGAHDGLLVTDLINCRPKISMGKAVSDTENDILKLVVLDRYKKRRPAIGFIHGFGLRDGAIASSISHDKHNIIAVGTNDIDIVNSINSLIDTKGGICTSLGCVIKQLHLPIAGLMSADSPENISEKYCSIKESVCSMGCKMKSPFMTLSFMSLHVIPSLKLTEEGLFDVNKFQPTTLFDF